MNYYERHIGDYLKDTAHLSLLHHGVYSRLMDVYYTRELGFTEGEVHRLIGARTKEERRATDEVLAEFFALQDGVWYQDRCDREIARYRDKQEKARRSAEARWSESGRNANAFQSGDAKPMRTHSEGNALQTPNTNLQKKDKAPASPSVTVDELIAEGVLEKTAVEFLAHRKRKRAALTPTAWEGIKAEAKKARWTIQAAVAKALMRGWTSFEAEWVKDAKTKAAELASATVPPSETVAENRRRLEERDRMTPEEKERADAAAKLALSAIRNITPRAA